MDELFVQHKRYMNSKIAESITNELTDDEFSRIPVEIYTDVHSHDSREVARLVQICQLIGLMHRKFGSKVDFCVDGSGHPMIELVTGLALVHAHWIRKFTLEFDEKDFEGVDAELLKFARQYVTKSNLTGFEWTNKISDANVFDSSQPLKNAEIDSRSTGPIPGSDIVLNGLSHSQECEFTIGGKPFSMTSQKCAEYFSTRHLIAIMTREVERKKDRINSFLLKMDRAELFAIKRSGDWGQVQHAKKYDKVFVTRDRLAALYAHFQGVKYMYMSYENYVDEIRDGFPPFYRYTFVL